MNSQNRSLIAIVAGIILFICVCAAIVLVAGVGMFWITGSRVTMSTPLVATHVVSDPPSVPATSSPEGEDITPNGEIPADVLAQMMEIEQQVIGLRGLPPNGEFHRALFSPDQLRERVINDFTKDYTPEDAQQDALVLAAFGLINPEFDFYTFYVDLLSEQVAGFYDDETKEMVVVQGEAFAGPERLTYAHEYTHALQDQNYAFEDGLGYTDEACEEDSERCAAIQALIEGDATLSELQWFSEHSTRQDQEDIFAFYDTFESPVYDSAPPFMQESFLFPYNQGYEFANYLFEEGGFPAVDAAYANLPVSTEQILHPENYPNDTPIPVTLPELLPVLGDGWELLDENVMGEWYTYLILARGIDSATQLDDDDAAEAAAGWGGDSYVVYLSPSGDSTAHVMSTIWDTTADASEFTDAFSDYADARFGSPTGEFTWESDGIATLFTVNGDQTIWVAAPDLATAQAILAAVQP